MGTIVVGTDGSRGATSAMEWAVREAALRGSDLEVVHAWELPAGGAVYAVPDLGYDTLAQEIADGAAELARNLAGPDHPLVVVARAVNSPPAPALIEASHHAELLVVGSRGHGTFAGLLLGSVGLHCASHATCPVVIVRPTDSAAADS